MFIGRKKELELIDEFLKKPSGAALIYGQRKVGKTTLILEALKQSKNKTAYFECRKDTVKSNIDCFVNSLVESKILDEKLIFPNFEQLFSFLNLLKIPLNIVIDEFSYLYSYEHVDTIDSIFQNVIDTRLSNIHLFISGSNISLMKELLYERDPLFGRFKMIIDLKPLDYKTCSLFYPDISTRDKIAFYSVFGGLPFANEFIDETKSINENIIKNLLDKNSPLLMHLENNLLSELSGSINANGILSTIANGKKKYSTIEEKIDITSKGILAKQLNVLLKMDTIGKISPINKRDDKKKTLYEIKDNLIRFYYTYIYKNKDLLSILSPQNFFNKYIEPTLNAYISHRFEQQCREYFILQTQNGLRNDLFNIGTYYYDDKINKKNGEFDVAIQKDNNKYDIYEVKYYQKPLRRSEMEKEIEQVKNIKDINIDKIGFISTSGFEENIEGCELINGEELYKS